MASSLSPWKFYSENNSSTPGLSDNPVLDTHLIEARRLIESDSSIKESWPIDDAYVFHNDERKKLGFSGSSLIPEGVEVQEGESKEGEKKEGGSEDNKKEKDDVKTDGDKKDSEKKGEEKPEPAAVEKKEGESGGWFSSWYSGDDGEAKNNGITDQDGNAVAPKDVPPMPTGKPVNATAVAVTGDVTGGQESSGPTSVHMVICHCREHLNWLVEGNFTVTPTDKMQVTLYIYDKCKEKFMLIWK